MQDKKEKKLPDPIEKEISKEAYPLVEAFLSHMKEIVIVVGCIIAVVIAYTGYKAYTHQKIENSKNELKTIFVLKDKKQKISKLRELLNRAPENLKYAIRMELAKLYTEIKDYKNAIIMWNDIEKDIEDKEIKVIATLAKAQCYALMNDYAKALNTISKIKDNKNYEKIILMEIAKFAEANNNVEQALWAYKKLKAASINDPNNIYYEYKIIELQSKLK